MQRKKIVKSYKLPYKLQFLANSDRNQHIAVCGFGREIKIYDYSLNLNLKTYLNSGKLGWFRPGVLRPLTSSQKLGKLFLNLARETRENLFPTLIINFIIRLVKKGNLLNQFSKVFKKGINLNGKFKGQLRPFFNYWKFGQV